MSNKTVVLDLESDGLYHEATQVHCGFIYNLSTAEYLGYSSKPLEGSVGDIQDMLNYLEDVDVVITFNGIGFDIPLLEKLYNFKYKGSHIDLMIISYLLYPDLMGMDIASSKIPKKLYGRHSLGAWGERLGNYKGDYGEQENAWETLTQDMFDYCKQDVALSFDLYTKFKSHKNYPSDRTLDLEQGFAQIMSRQEKYGVYFDVKGAQKLHVELLEEKQVIEEELKKVFKPISTWKPKPYPAKPTKKDGNKSAILIKQEEAGYYFNDKGEWGRFEDDYFSPGSRKDIVRWLSEVYGWTPKEFTEKGNPIVNDTVLAPLEFDGGKLLAKYFKIIKILGYVAEGKNAWIKLAKGGRMHGRVKTLGAVTRRCTHTAPNLAQVPSSRSYKGKECRSLFCIPTGYKLVGADADALELRMLGHFMFRYDEGEYAHAVHAGLKSDETDAHNLNKRAMGLTCRDEAKKKIYSFLYGCGDDKMGDGNPAYGKKLKQSLLSTLPALKYLIDAVKLKAKKTKHINALDGHPLFVRSAHAALNTLLQSAGSLCCKQWVIEIDKEMRKRGYTPGEDYEFVLNIQDECQAQVKETLATEFAEVTQEVNDRVTSHFNLNIPFVSNAMIGNNWAETH